MFCYGNHDYYSKTDNINDIINKTREYIEKNNIDNIIFLENDYCYIENVLFVGCTLWTNFDLYKTKEYTKYLVGQKINDYKSVRYNNRLVTPDDIENLHNQSVKFLEKKLSNKNVKKIIVTHHAPHRESINLKYLGDKLNPAYASDLSSIIDNYSPSIWIHGHIHNFSNFLIKNTRIICNPFGYHFEEDSGFRYPFVIEI